MLEMNNDQDALEALTRLDERLTQDVFIVDGKRKGILHRSIRYLFDIEQFVIDIETEYAKNGRARGIRLSVDGRGYPNIKMFKIGKKYYGKLDEWIGRYSDKHRYAPKIEAFYEACKELGLLGGKKRFWFGSLDDTDEQHDVLFVDWFNQLLVKIHERCSTREFKERERLRKVHEREMKERVEQFEEALFSEEGRSRWLVLSLTLKYQPQYRRWITLEDVQRHRDRFFAARGYKQLMGHIRAYAWTLEEGESTGFHLHVVLFCDCVTRDDERLAKEIGDYWEEVVTEGKGAYWNSNEERLKRFYERKRGIGVGQIDRRNEKMRQALRENLVYLVKAEQLFQIKVEGKIHTFGMSNVPKKRTAGRPRNGSGVDLDNEVDISRLKEILAEKSPSTATSKAVGRWRKSGVPLPFSVEATASVD